MFVVFYKFYILIIEDNTRLIGCLVSRKNNTFCYISNRYQRVIIRNCLSEKGNLKGGVPQGSVLGPLLFLLYINDIADNTQSLYFQYDNAIYNCGKR
jgi:hypothetical protein